MDNKDGMCNGWKKACINVAVWTVTNNDLSHRSLCDSCYDRREADIWPSAEEDVDAAKKASNTPPHWQRLKARGTGTV